MVHGNEYEAGYEVCLIGYESHTYCDTKYTEMNVKLDLKSV